MAFASGVCLGLHRVKRGEESTRMGVADTSRVGGAQRLAVAVTGAKETLKGFACIAPGT